MSIKIENLTYVYMPKTPFEKKALDNVNLEIEDGEFLAVIGHTGSGKSTLIQHLNGLLKPASGKIYVDGTDITDKDTKLVDIRKKVGLVFQYPEYQLFEETIAKDIAYGPTNLGLNEDEILKEILKCYYEDQKRYEELFTEETVMSYINNKNLDSYYADFYKQELIGNLEDSKDNIVEHEIDGIITILDSSNSVIDFLITNKNSWKIEGENIVFANQELSEKFLELINDMLENIPGTLIEKDFGTYEIPVDWIESAAHSTNDKFFYVKEGQENENRPNNISINEGSNKYAANEHENFRMAILNQLSMQIGEDENVEVTANGSNTKNGYVVYTFNIKDQDNTTTQYYIVGDYKYILVHETTFGDSAETDSAAQKIIDTFKWKE